MSKLGNLGTVHKGQTILANARIIILILKLFIHWSGIVLDCPDKVYIAQIQVGKVNKI